MTALKRADTITLFDLSNIMFRAFYGVAMYDETVRELPSAEPDDAQAERFGAGAEKVVAMARKVIRRICGDLGVNPLRAMLVGEVPGENWRRAKYPEYKAGRKPKPGALVTALQPEWLDLLADVVPRVKIFPGHEADDVIATFTDQLDNQFYESIVVSGDADLLQCASGQTGVYLLKQKQADNRVWRPSDFAMEYGFAPRHFAHYKALAGDTSDNIPGVYRVGEAYAREAIKHYHTLDSLYRILDTGEEPYLKPAVKTNLLKGRADAYLYLELCTLNRYVPGAELKG